MIFWGAENIIVPKKSTRRDDARIGECHTIATMWRRGLGRRAEGMGVGGSNDGHLVIDGCCCCYKAA